MGKSVNDDGSIGVWARDFAGPMSNEEMREIAEIPDTWIDIDFKSNKWDANAGHGERITLWQATGRYKPPLDSIRGLEGLIDQLSGVLPKLPKVKYARRISGSDETLLKISPVDLHLGMYAWAEHTGQAYDMDIATSLFLGAIKDLLDKAKPFRPDKILFLLGNDYLHVDNAAYTTTKGTPQGGTSGTFQEMFQRGVEALIEAIEMCRGVAPVEVILVPGNHDQNVSWMLGQILEARYRKEKSVNVDCNPSTTKYYKWGDNILGFVHGNLSAKALKDLPILMANECKEWWADSKFRCWYTGHGHRRATGEIQGVRFEQLPSLTAVNAWHFDNAYRNQWRAAMAFIFRKRGGFVAQLSVNVDPETGRLL